MQTKGPLPWLMLFSRSALFLLAQSVIAIILRMIGTENPWLESARWWILFPIFANIASIALLGLVFKMEGRRYLDILRFSRVTLKTDLIWFFGSSLIGLPIATVPIYTLGTAIFGDSMTPIQMLFRPLPDWALLLSLLFPLTIGLAELPTYFGYVMPRLFNGISSWLAFLIAAGFLGLQHCFLPVIGDGRYLLWRGLMYLPFALYSGLMVKLRPSLLPYFAVVHSLMDLSIISVYLTI